MASLDERVTNLEAQTDNHAAAIAAVRTDIAGLRLELRTDLATVRSDMATLRSELRGDIATLRGDMALRSETTELRRELHTGIESLRTDLRELSRRTDRLVLWVATTQAGIFLGVIGMLIEALYR